SFGDYFKKEAIDWAWELLTQVYGIPKDKLFVTVFGGDASDGLALDEEARGYWKAHLPEDRILLGSKKDNFWEMGESGPCGPCSEIHVDLRTESERRQVPGQSLVNHDHPQVVEVWNLVFIEFNRRADGSLEKLPASHVDTGMGFERLCMALQGKTSNYDTDVFQPLIQKISEIAGIPYGQDKLTDIAMRVVADHLRAVAFAIADGQLPSNVRAGYVIRRILRRAIRYAFTFLKLEEPFIYQVFPVLAGQMGDVFPELRAQRELVSRVIAEEEHSFLKTLSLGIQRFQHYLLQHPGDAPIDGAFAFELFDTYGFPVDLTRLMAREQGREVDMQGFEKGLSAQKERSRADAATELGDWTLLMPEAEETRFTGYDELSCEARIVKYRQVTARNKTLYQVVLDRTPFYAESGGQVGDRGWLEQDGKRVAVTDTRKENNLIVHLTDELPYYPEQPVLASVDGEARTRTECNHSATHLLHHALRAVLGSHVEQKGSLVEPDRLRFDFSHFARMEASEVVAVEQMVNRLVRSNAARDEHRAMPMAQAREMGA
ncbi:MAG TPA: alanine--tRNA ligase, partial [Bacteroidales bacterium]|nr:alanine--tRNA ligase [Bacteroidales bacterium]